MKSLTRITFDQDVEDFDTLYKSLELLINKLHETVMKKKYLFQTVVIKIRFENFSTYTRQLKLKTPINDRNLALKVAKDLLKEFESKPMKVRLLGFRFTQLSKPKYVQKTLLD